MDAAAGCIDLETLASFLDFAPQHLFSLIKNPAAHYRQFEIKKKSGGMREIHCPSPSLRGVQRAILDKLLAKCAVHDAAHAYRKGRSALSCARQISGAGHLLILDIRNFFPSITDKRVHGLFRSLDLNENVAFMLTRLTTFQHHAIQGAPTSPCISNLILRKMDAELSSFSNEWGIKYVRYSDDLLFSSLQAVGWKTFRTAAGRIVRDNGFELNDAKTRAFRNGAQKFALGFRLDTDTPAIMRKTRHRYRAMFHHAAMQPVWGKRRLAELKGIAAWYRSVVGSDDTYREYQAVLTSLQRLKAHEPFST